MAYEIEVESFLEVSIVGSLNGQECMNVLHYFFQEGATIEDGRASALAFLAVFNAAGNVRPKFTALVVESYVHQVYAQWIDPLRYRAVTGAGGPYSGDLADPALPQNVAITITKYGDLANRKNIGSVHVPAVPPDVVVDGEITPVQAAPYVTFAEQCLETIVLPTGQIMAPVIYNRADPITSPYWTDFFVQGTSRVMRRRTVGVGA